MQELITGDIPFPEAKTEDMVLLDITSRELPPIPKTLEREVDHAVWKLCGECWQWNPSSRPTAHKIQDYLRYPPFEHGIQGSDE